MTTITFSLDSFLEDADAELLQAQVAQLLASADKEGSLFEASSVLEFPELFTLGQTLENFQAMNRFEGVRENLVRELRGGMCTLEQAYAYLENFELQLLKEQELEQ